jgi:hypothetical protein
MESPDITAAEAASIGLHRDCGSSGLLRDLAQPAKARSELLFYAALWTFVGLLSAAQDIAVNIARGHPAAWGQTVGTALLNWYTCGIGTPVYIWLVRRFPLTGPTIAARTALYCLVLLLSVPAKYLVWVPLENAIFHTSWSLLSAASSNVFAVFMGQLSFIVFLYAIEYYRAARQRELRANQLEVELSNAQLETMRSQMHPHFLFNTLNSISTLMHRDVAAADELICRLGEMLRASFTHAAQQEVPLGWEIELTNRYLEIMRVRFGTRLTAGVEVPQALLAEQVPSFLLQPIVENAVRHGIEDTSDAIDVRVTGAISGGFLRFSIIDNGRGPTERTRTGHGIGLGNTRRRIERLYGPCASLDIRRRPDGGGAEVTIIIPSGMYRERQVTSSPMLRPTSAS